MCGKFKGAQQKLSELLNREIPFTKCIPNGVNLVVKHGCAVMAIIGKVLEQIFVSSVGSTKRYEKLNEKSREVDLNLSKLFGGDWMQSF